MINSKAQALKDLGNTAFKSGDYPAAIGHYTSAILLNKDDPTYPLNRAAAYLKLGKHQDAESDCSKVLDLSPKNPKALYRRAQARIGLGKLQDAKNDLDQVAAMDRTNDAVKKELINVESLIINEMQKTTSRQEAASIQRRRVPIKIIEPTPLIEDIPSLSPAQQISTESANPSVSFLEHVSSRPLKKKTNSSSPPSTSIEKKATAMTPPASSDLFQQAKQTRDTQRPSRVGGGVFHADGKSTIFKTRENFPVPDSPAAPSSTASKPSIFISKILPKPPSTLFDLVRSWEQTVDPEDRFSLLSTIPPSRYRVLYQSSLEPSFLISVLQTFTDVMQKYPNDDTLKEAIKKSLFAFGTVPRFGTLLMFMSNIEQGMVRQIWDMLGGLNDDQSVWHSAF